MDPCSGTDSMVVSFGLRPSTKKATRATKPLSIHMFKTCQTHISCQVQDLILWHEIGMMGHFNYIFVFSPALPNPTTGCGGKVETEPLQPNSSGHPKSPKLMDLCQQVGSVNVQTPDEISESQAFDFPPIQWKKVWSAAAWSSDSLHCRLDEQRLWTFSQRFSGSKDRWQEGILHTAGITFLEPLLWKFYVLT